eukprot:scaffold7951_cov80-Skeletonema_marinoi.AAC.1
MRVLPIIVGSSVLTTSFAQQYRTRSSSMRICSTAINVHAVEWCLTILKEHAIFVLTVDVIRTFVTGSHLELALERRRMIRMRITITSTMLIYGEVELRRSGSRMKMITMYGGGVDKWSKDEVDSDASASASAILPSRSRQRQERGLAWSPPNWGAPKYTDTEPKPYYHPPPAPANYYYPPVAPEFVETCCSSNERVCPMDFPMQKQVFLSGKVRVCCFTRRVDAGGGGYYPYSYGGGGYQYQTRTPRNGYGYGNRKLQYGYGSGGGYTYGQQPSYYGDSYANRLPAQCPATQTTPSPTKAPTKAVSIYIYLFQTLQRQRFSSEELASIRVFSSLFHKISYMILLTCIVPSQSLASPCTNSSPYASANSCSYTSPLASANSCSRTNNFGTNNLGADSLSDIGTNSGTTHILSHYTTYT